MRFKKLYDENFNANDQSFGPTIKTANNKRREYLPQRKY